MVKREELVAYINELLDIGRFQDYAPNGLQVQGCAEISILVSGVSACHALLEKAVEKRAHAVLVHHGYFWRGEDPCITGMKHQRLKTLLAHHMNLLGYHLPLDAHEHLGNNAQLAKRLGLTVDGMFQDVGMHGRLVPQMSGEEFAGRIEEVLGRQPLHVPCSRPVRTIAWCSGGAQGYIEAAAQMGVDAYLSGEASEQTFHIAREYDIHYFGAGHHATEKYGAMALGEHLAQKFALKHEFVDIENPI